ncbi:MAG TPA: FHA domain-containing protein [Kiritimatiellia bacterium]|nr:FHA domain-containing protein [Kiritimatiellia bacterium]HRZ12767.1 FHA domain-containing protein [Kiritimatiellia bacterium]HSA18281.1 FHA domain-containing protein [Kiritimatiellia bacterium]
MRLRYAKKDGTQMEFELGDRPITIGRSPEADVVVLDEKVSRVHCGIRLWDGEFFIKDLKSRNGTTVNGQRVEMVKLNPGDRIRVGSTTFLFEQEAGPQTDDALKEMQQAMADGKGYSTILQEIVEDIAAPAAPEGAPPGPAPADQSASPMPPPEKPAPPKTVVKKPAAPKAGAPFKVVIRKPAP